MNFAASDDFRGEGRALHRAIISQHVDRLTFRPGDEVFDVGCGSGEDTKTIASKVKRVVGIDSSKEMISVANQNHSALNIEYVIEDARSVADNPDWREKFDKILSIFMLHWIPTEEQPSTLGSILSCLKPGGEALMLMDTKDQGPHDISASVFFLKNHPKWGAYTKNFELRNYLWNRSMPDTVKLLETSGCTVLQCEIKKEKFSLSKLQLKLLVKTVYGFLDLVPAGKQDELFEDVWRWMLSRSADESKSRYIHVDESVVIHVRKQ